MERFCAVVCETLRDSQVGQDSGVLLPSSPQTVYYLSCQASVRKYKHRDRW